MRKFLPNRRLSTINKDSVSNVIRCTSEWVTKFVAGLNLCPYAKPVLVKGTLNFVELPLAYESCSNEELLDTCKLIAQQALLLKEKSFGHTTIVVLPNLTNDFPTYLEFVHIVEDVLQEVALDEDIQIASFHPNYCFNEVSEEDVGNFTNRSPYPMLHLLRVDDVSLASKRFPDGDTSPVWKANIDTMKKLGRQRIEAMLASYKH